jgi:hypothetical protein
MPEEKATEYFAEARIAAPIAPIAPIGLIRRIGRIGLIRRIAARQVRGKIRVSSRADAR